jgi:ParB family protein of integrating conjugative element (PFGI_1 class)
MSKIKPLTDENIFSFLKQETNDDKLQDDPISKTEIPVTLDQLQPYALNPRRSKNPKYDEILYSIETVGLDNPPRITRRSPDDEKYSIRDGGNTRLEILSELYEKYTLLAKKADDKDEKEAFLEKADSFYNIKCDFYPWYDDTQALSAHMRENEARGETKFIEKALAVQKLHELYIEEDLQKSNLDTNSQQPKPLSLRKLAERISKDGGWKIDFSHISRFNYAVDTLLKYIPNVFWAGAGQPLVRKLGSLINAYETFWRATAQGKKEPEKIDDIFYTTLSEFDDEKLDIKVFTQELDIRLEDIVGVPCLSIMAEINAIMNGSKRSLRYEPDALQQLQAEKPNPAQDATHELKKPLSINPKTTESSYLPVETNKVQIDLDSAPSKVKVNNKNILDESQPPSSNDENSSLSVITKPDKFPNHLPALRKLIVNQVKNISDLSPGYIGLMIMDEKNPEQKHYIENNIFFDAVNFFDAELHAYPVFGQSVDDTRTMIWWQLQKYSRDYSISDHGQFDKLMQKALDSYLKAIQSINPEHRLIDVILWLEHKLMQQPELMQECIRLQQMQARLLETISDQNKAMELEV